MERWPPRGPSRHYDDDPYPRRGSPGSDPDQDHPYYRGRDFRNDDDRRRPHYADREGYRSSAGDYRSFQDRDRNYDGYYDGYDSRSGRENHRAHRDREHSRLRYSDSPTGRRSVSPERYHRRSSQDFGNQPSNELKLSGLPKDDAYTISEDTVRQPIPRTIKQQIESICKIALSSVRVIRDRATGQPKGFGFVTFPTVDGATQFYDEYKTGLVIYGHGSDKYNVELAYAINRAREPKNQTDPEWICQLCGMSNRATRTVCFRSTCKAPRDSASGSAISGPTQAPHKFNGTATLATFGKPGESDRSPDGVPSHFLLVLGLTYNVNTTILAKGVAKLYIEDQDPTQSQAPKTINALRSTTASIPAGAPKGSIKRAFLVRDKKSNESRRYGIVEFHTVDDAVAALARFNAKDSFTIASCDIDMSHPHNGIFKPALGPPSEYTVELGMAGQKMEYWDYTAYVVEEWINKDPPATENRTDETPSTAQESKDGAKVNLTTKKQTKKRKAEDADPLRDPGHNASSLFGAWNKAKEELNDQGPDKIGASSFLHVTDGKHCCLLCGTKLKSKEIALKHEVDSTFHKSNLLDPEKVRRGLEKLRKHGLIDKVSQGPSSSTASSNEPYNDRAKQRRLESKQSETPVQKISFSFGTKKNATTQEHEPEPEPEPATNTKGLDLLRKMGYSGSGGLGADGAGTADVLPVSMYAAGVGLGAEGGKLGDAVEEADRNTRNNRDEYVEKMKEKAKARYFNM